MKVFPPPVIITEKLLSGDSLADNVRKKECKETTAKATSQHSPLAIHRGVRRQRYYIRYRHSNIIYVGIILLLLERTIKEMRYVPRNIANYAGYVARMYARVYNTTCHCKQFALAINTITVYADTSVPAVYVLKKYVNEHLHSRGYTIIVRHVNLEILP